MVDRTTKLEELLKKARQLPKSPGVYLMKDDKGVVVYVGKAANLPDRVTSYFQPAAIKSALQSLGPKKAPLLDVVDDFDIIECEGEWEALLTENRLIKDIHPRFNERLTDDKTFPYLVITVRDDFPGVFITRQPTHPDYKGAKVLGPFTSVYALRESMQLLQRVFKFRTCTLDIREDDDNRRYFRPCLLYPIKQCTAPCGDKVSKEAYREDINRLIRFLESKRSVMRSSPIELDIAFAPGSPAGVAPVAFDYSKRVLVNEPILVELPVASDEDPASLSYTILSGPTQATLALGAGGYAFVTPNPGATGTDTISYRVDGPGGSSNIATVTIEITNAATRRPSIQALASAQISFELALPGGATLRWKG